MAILKKQRRTTYTVIDNEAVRNTDLSWRATGLLVYLLSLPDDWSVNVTDLSRRKVDGKTATRSTMQELEDAGYLTIKTEYEGTLRRYIWTVYEEPQPVDSDSDQVDGRSSDGQTTDDASTDTQVLVSTQDEVTINEVTNSEIAATPPRNPWWDVTVELFGEPAANQRSLYGRFVAMVSNPKARMRASDPDTSPERWYRPNEIRRRAGLLAELWGVKAVTVASLEKHWSRFDAAIGQVTDADVEAFTAAEDRAAMTARLADE